MQEASRFSEGESEPDEIISELSARHDYWKLAFINTQVPLHALLKARSVLCFSSTTVLDVSEPRSVLRRLRPRANMVHCSSSHGMLLQLR